MDELTFRRQAYADPHCQSQAFLAQMQAKAEHQSLVFELKALDAKLSAALSIAPPNGLAVELQLKPYLQQQRLQRRQMAGLVAMAATVAFLLGMSVNWLRSAPIDLSEHALAHLNHEPAALLVDQRLNLQQVNAQLASISKLKQNQFTAPFAKVYFAAVCDFQGVKSLHLVMQGDKGKVTLFIVPLEHRQILNSSFINAHYEGLGFEIGDTYMLLVGDSQTNLDLLKDEIKNTFI